MKNFNLKNSIIYLALVFIFLSCTYFAFLILYTPKYFVTEQPFKLEKTTYRVGDTLTYTSNYCKYRVYTPLNIKRSLVDGYVYPLPAQSEDTVSLGTFPVGCRTATVDVPLTLPVKVPTNQKYHVEISVDYYINPLKTETRTFKTEEFTLLPSLTK